MSTLPETLVTTYLEMTSPDTFQPGFTTAEDVLLLPMQQVDVTFYLFLYQTVGEAWKWRDRLLMPREELTHILASPQTRVYVLYAGGVPAGYFELFQEETHVEIAYFGLRPEFIGRGLGKHLLSAAIQQAWQLENAQRIWLHTCNLDGPHALQNYIARGFTIYDVQEEPMPERYA
ncbi:MAG: GNAT family N-acetyltransferase [Anaerolineae bacterium]